MLHRTVESKFSSYYGASSQQPSLLLFAPHHPVYGRLRNESASTTAGKASTGTISGSGSGSGCLVLLLLSATDGRETLVDLTKTLTEMAQNGKIKPKDISVDLVDAEISEVTMRPSSASSSFSSSSPSPSSSPSSSKVNGYGYGFDFEQENGQDKNGQNKNHNSTTNSHVNPLSPFSHLKTEADLLLTFGPSLFLDGYPPWHIRLSEIFCVGARCADVIGYHEAVEYQGFLRGLYHYAGSQMRFGR